MEGKKEVHKSISARFFYEIFFWIGLIFLVVTYFLHSTNSFIIGLILLFLSLFVFEMEHKERAKEEYLEFCFNKVCVQTKKVILFLKVLLALVVALLFYLLRSHFIKIISYPFGNVLLYILYCLIAVVFIALVHNLIKSPKEKKESKKEGAEGAVAKKSAVKLKKVSEETKGLNKWGPMDLFHKLLFVAGVAFLIFTYFNHSTDSFIIGLSLLFLSLLIFEIEYKKEKAGPYACALYALTILSLFILFYLLNGYLITIITHPFRNLLLYPLYGLLILVIVVKVHKKIRSLREGMWINWGRLSTKKTPLNAKVSRPRTKQAEVKKQKMPFGTRKHFKMPLFFSMKKKVEEKKPEIKPVVKRISAKPAKAVKIMEPEVKKPKKPLDLKPLKISGLILVACLLLAVLFYLINYFVIRYSLYPWLSYAIIAVILICSILFFVYRNLHRKLKIKEVVKAEIKRPEIKKLKMVFNIKKYFKMSGLFLFLLVLVAILYLIIRYNPYLWLNYIVVAVIAVTFILILIYIGIGAQKRAGLKREAEGGLELKTRLKPEVLIAAEGRSVRPQEAGEIDLGEQKVGWGKGKEKPIGLDLVNPEERKTKRALETEKLKLIDGNEEGMPPVGTEGGGYETPLDSVYKLVEEMGKVKISAVAKIFNVSKKHVEEWAEILEEHGLLRIRYPPIGEPELVKVKP